MTFENPVIHEDHEVSPWLHQLDFAAQVESAKTVTLQRTHWEVATASGLFWVHLFWLPLICALAFFPLTLGLLAAIDAWVCPLPRVLELSLVAAYLAGLIPSLYKTRLLYRYFRRKRYVRTVDLTLDFDRQALVAKARYAHVPVRNRQELVPLEEVDMVCRHHFGSDDHDGPGISAHHELYLVIRGPRSLRQRWARERLMLPVMEYAYDEKVAGAREASAAKAEDVAAVFRNRVHAVTHRPLPPHPARRVTGA